MTELAHKRVLITGGAQGIGRTMAEAFAAQGATIVLTDVDKKTLSKTAKEMRADGATVHDYVLDVTDHKAILALRERIVADVGPVEVLVNNAGIVHGGEFDQVPLERHLFTYQVNTIGLVAVTHAFMPDILKQPEGHVVIIASASAMVGLPYGTTYASSKWAAMGFGESLRLELELLGHDNVHVTTVCPSYINTGMFEGVKAPKLTPMLDPKVLADQVIEAVEQNEPLLLTPSMVKLIPIMRGLLPLRWVENLQWRFGVNTSMKRWKGKYS